MCSKNKFFRFHTAMSAAVGALCIVAYLVWGIAYRFTPPHLWFWLVAGVVFLMPCLFRLIKLRLPKWLRISLMALLGLMLAVFFVFEGFVIGSMNDSYNGELDVIIVLGARVKGTEPSDSLSYRIDEAEAYLKLHPSTVAILTGGMGFDEDVSEAECMRQKLADRGIDEARLIIEDKATSTVENVRYSAEVYDLSGKKIGIVSSGFHLFRAKLTASSIGISAVGISAKSDGFILPHYMMREFATTVSDTLSGNIKISAVFGGQNGQD